MAPRVIAINGKTGIDYFADRRTAGAVELNIPVLPPSANRLWRVSRGRIHPSEAYENWINQAGHFVNRQCPGTILGKYKVVISVQRNKKDLDNHAKVVSDLLQKMGVVENDKHCEKITLEWMDQGEGLNIRVERC